MRAQRRGDPVRYRIQLRDGQEPAALCPVETPSAVVGICMTSKDNAQDEELLARDRRASDTAAAAPSESVRSAILAEGRRAAEQLAKNAPPRPFDVSRPAANDARWKITAYGTVGAALLAALLIAPRFWESQRATQVSSA